MSPSTFESVLFIPMNLAIPVYVAPEEIEVGRHVFHNFVHDEFVHQGLSDDVLSEDEGAQGDANGFIDENFAFAHREFFQARAATSSAQLASTPEGYKSIAISQVGSTIRELANEFARSRQREAIRHEADEVDLGAITVDRFWGLLDEVFRHGITSHNLIALFFFCSDVLIRCVKSKLRNLGMNLFRWSLQFIAERVCKWVHEKGGWEKAIQNTLINTRYFVAAAAVVAIAAVGWLSLKGIKK